MGTSFVMYGSDIMRSASSMVSCAPFRARVTFSARARAQLGAYLDHVDELLANVDHRGHHAQ